MSDTVQPEMCDFFESSYGLLNWPRRFAKARDVLFDARLTLNLSYLKMSANIKKQPQRSILIAGVEVPARSQDLRNVMQALSRTRHNVTVKFAALGEGLGKFQNINACLRDVDINSYDWLVVVDDDIAFEEGFLDKFIYLAERTDLHICMPAHKFNSYQSFELTVRHWNSLVRVTHFVESGPVTAFRRTVFSDIFPFPELRWAWGTDIAWSVNAGKKNLKIGIIDGVPVRHLRPVSMSYDWTLAKNEASAFILQAKIKQQRKDILKTVKVLSSVEKVL